MSEKVKVKKKPTDGLNVWLGDCLGTPREYRKYTMECGGGLEIHKKTKVLAQKYDLKLIELFPNRRKGTLCASL